MTWDERFWQAGVFVLGFAVGVGACAELDLADPTQTVVYRYPDSAPMEVCRQTGLEWRRADWLRDVSCAEYKAETRKLGIYMAHCWVPDPCAEGGPSDDLD